MWKKVWIKKKVPTVSSVIESGIKLSHYLWKKGNKELGNAIQTSVLRPNDKQFSSGMGKMTQNVRNAEGNLKNVNEIFRGIGTFHLSKKNMWLQISKCVMFLRKIPSAYSNIVYDFLWRTLALLTCIYDENS